VVTPADLRALVPVMRELGVVSCCGIVLGPAPARLDQLRDGLVLEESPGERERLEREARRQAVFQEYRDKLAATGREYTDAQLMQFIPPERFED
jgi:hypothetical protein